MKRTVVALALVIGVLPALVRGQASVISQVAGEKTATEKLYFGLKAGMSCGRLKGLDGVERRGGPNFGVQATIALSGRLSLVPEVTFVSPKGVTGIPFATTGDPDLDPAFADPARSALMLGYVDVPVQVRYRLGRFHFGAGGYAGFLVSAREKFRAARPSGEDLIFATDVAEDYPGHGFRPALRGVLDDHPAAPRRRARLPPPLAGGTGRHRPGALGAAIFLAPGPGQDVGHPGVPDLSIRSLRFARRFTMLKQMQEALIVGKKAEVESLVDQALAAGMPAGEILNQGLIPGMERLGVQFKANEVFIPEVLVAARAMNAGLAKLEPHLAKAGVKPRGIVVIGTVKGDLHDIGKNLVAMMLRGNGYKIVDLGVDVAPEKYLEAAKTHEAGAIALSALLTTTMVQMKAVIEAVEKAGLAVPVVIGGAPVTREYAEQIRAKGYAPDAASAVEEIGRLLAS